MSSDDLVSKNKVTVYLFSETALQLEALIGDLEDAVLCVMNQKTANMLSTRLSDPCIPNVMKGSYYHWFLLCACWHVLDEFQLKCMFQSLFTIIKSRS